MTKPVVIIDPAPDAPGILHIDEDAWKRGPVAKHDVGHEAGERSAGEDGEEKSDTV